MDTEITPLTADDFSPEASETKRITKVRLKESDKDEWKELEFPKLPCKKGEEISFDVAQRWFDKLDNPLVKNRVKIYVYRVWPVINRPRGQRYLDKTDLNFFSTNKLIASFGGGEYRIDVNEKAGNHDKLFYFRYSVDSTTYPPIVDLNELALGDEKNKSYVEMLKAKGELVVENGELKVVDKRNNKTESSSTSITDVAGVIKEMMSFAKSFEGKQQDSTAQLVNFMIEKMKTEESKNSSNMSSIAQLITAISAIIMPILNRPKDDSNDKLLTLLLSEMQESKKQQAELLGKIFESKADPIKNIKETAELLEMLKGDKEDKDEERPKSLTDKLIEKSIDLLPMITQGFTAMANNKNAPPQQVVNQPQQIETNGQFQEVKQESVEMTREKMIAQIINQYGGMIANQILNHKSASEFANQVVSMFGHSVWNQVAQFSSDEILAGFNSNQPFRNALSSFSDDELKNWIEEFINYGKN